MNGIEHKSKLHTCRGHGTCEFYLILDEIDWKTATVGNYSSEMGSHLLGQGSDGIRNPDKQIVFM